MIFERSEKIIDFERSEKSPFVIAPKEQLTSFLAALAQVKNAFFKFAEFGKISEFWQKFGFLKIRIYSNFQGRRSRRPGFETRRVENPGQVLVNRFLATFFKKVAPVNLIKFLSNFLIFAKNQDLRPPWVWRRAVGQRPTAAEIFYF